MVHANLPPSLRPTARLQAAAAAVHYYPTLPFTALPMVHATILPFLRPTAR